MKTKTVILTSGPESHQQVSGSVYYQWVSADNLDRDRDARTTPPITHRPFQYQWVIPIREPQYRRDAIAQQIAEDLSKNRTRGESGGYRWREDGQD